MACTSCSQNTCNCTSTSICETCIDVTSSECIYYKGYLTNNLGLAANFRFNTFAEKVIDVLGGINSVLDTYPISIDLARDNTASHPSSYESIITLNKTVTIGGSPTDFIKDTIDQRLFYAYTNFTTGDLSIGGTAVLLPLQASASGATYGHSVVDSSGNEYIETAARLGKQRITLDLGYSITAGVDVHIRVNVFESKRRTSVNTTAIKTYWITAKSGVATSNVLSFSFITDGPTTESNTVKVNRYYVEIQSFTNKGAGTGSNQTLTIDSGSFSVEETGY
jgi:hypothetical protein